MSPRELILCYWQHPPPGAVDEILERMASEGLRFGHETSVWHEVHRWLAEHDDRPRCPLCGSRMDKRLTEHNLCRARADRRLPTPPLDDTRRCPCAKCAKEKAACEENGGFRL